MENLGIDRVSMPTFTQETANLSPEEFLSELMRRWDVRGLVAGFNYTFGKNGAGTPDTLKMQGNRYGFLTEILEPTMFQGEPVSSSRIRRALEAGDVETAAQMLGRDYSFTGTVVANRHIGHTIGFPTANLLPESWRVIPRHGVYGAVAEAEGRRYPAVTNIGTNPTVGGESLSVESHLIGYQGDLYGKQFRVWLRFRIRGEIRFASVEALQEQIAADAERVRKTIII